MAVFTGAQAGMPFDAGTPAINHADGIARLMGDGALFARVLARFREDYRDAALGIRKALDAGETALALRLAHTLKGAAGMIEAVPLRHAAQSLEQALRNGSVDPRTGLAQLDRALAQVLRELDAAAERGALLSATAQSGASVPPPRPEHADALARLAALLDEGNGDAVDLVREAEATLRKEMGDRAYGRVAAAIESFDFDAALALLRQRTGMA